MPARIPFPSSCCCCGAAPPPALPAPSALMRRPLPLLFLRRRPFSSALGTDLIPHRSRWDQLTVSRGPADLSHYFYRGISKGTHLPRVRTPSRALPRYASSSLGDSNSLPSDGLPSDGLPLDGVWRAHGGRQRLPTLHKSVSTVCRGHAPLIRRSPALPPAAGDAAGRAHACPHGTAARRPLRRRPGPGQGLGGAIEPAWPAD